MNYTEEQIFEKAKQILKDLHGEFFKEEEIKKGIWFRDKHEVSRPRGAIMPTWTITIEDALFDTLDFLVISDETGEPLYLHTKHLVLEIEKNEDGIYVTIS